MVECRCYIPEVIGSSPFSPTMEQKALNKKEIFICEITWGNVPLDVNWVRNSKLFQEKMARFDEYKYLMDDNRVSREKQMMELEEEFLKLDYRN